MNWSTVIALFIMAGSVAFQVYAARSGNPSARHQLAGSIVIFTFGMLLLTVNGMEPRRTDEARTLDVITVAVLVATMTIFAVLEFILWRRYRREYRDAVGTP